MCVSVAGQQRARRFPRLDSAARGIRSIFYGGGHSCSIGGRWRTEQIDEKKS